MAKAARRGLTALAGLVLLLAFLLVTAALLVESRWMRGLVEAQVSQRVDGREVTLGELDVDWGWPLGIQLRDLSLANADWAEHEQMLEVAALNVTLNVGQLLTGSIDLERVDVEQPVIHLARRKDGTANWDALMSRGSAPEGQAESDGGLGIQPDIITIGQGQLTYQDAARDANVSVDFQTSGEGAGAQGLQIQAQGRFQGKPLQLSVQGGAPSRALTETEYAVNLDGNLGDIELHFDGQTRNVWQLQALQGQVNISVPEQVDVATLLGQPALSVPSLDFQAQLTHEQARWALENIEMQAGESQLTGLLVLEQGDTPRFDVQLHADQLDLNRWGVMELVETSDDPTGTPAQGQGEQETAANQAIKTAENGASLEQRLTQQLAPLREYAGQVEVTVGQLQYSEETLRDIAFEAQLDKGRLDLQQLRILQDDGKLAGQGWLDVQSREGSLDARVDQFDLGQALAPLGGAELGVLDGEVHARFTNGVLTLQESQLAYRAPAQSLEVQVQAESRDIAETQASGVHVQGSGARNGQDFRFDLMLGPLLDLTNPDQPYPVEGKLAAAGISGQIDGTITQPLSPTRMDIAVQAQGDDLSGLNRLLEGQVGLDLPADTSFRLQGRLQMNQQAQRWALQDLEAQLGDSQLTGSLVLVRSDTPRIDVQLHADQLDLNRWGIMELIASDTAVSESARNPRVSLPANNPAEQRLVQQLESLRRYQGEVDIAIDRLSYGNEVLRNVVIRLQLDGGCLEIEQLRAVQDDGEFSAQGWLNARPNAMNGALDVHFDQVDLGQALSPLGYGALGSVNGELHARLVNGALALDDSQLAYHAPARELSVQLSVESRGNGNRKVSGTQAPGVHVEGSGTRSGQPFSFDLNLGSLLDLNNFDTPSSLQGTLTAGETSLQVEGTVTQPLDPASVDVSLQADSSNLASVNRLAGLDLPTEKPFHLQGQLQAEQLNQENPSWKLQDLQARMGESRLTGSLATAQGGMPRFEIQLHADQLDLNRWGIMDLLEPTNDPQAERKPLQQRLARQLSPLQRYRGQVDVSIGQLSYDEEVLRDVVLKGELNKGRLKIRRLHAIQGEGELTAQGWLEVQPGSVEGSLNAQLDQVDLGQVLAPLGYAELGTLDGELHGRFRGGALTLQDTQLTYSAPAQGLRVQLSADTQASGVHVEGRSRWQGEPFRFDLTLGALLALNDPDRPMPVKGWLASRETTLYIDGTLNQPLGALSVDAQLRLEGPSPATLHRLIGVKLPDLPPYRVSGRLRWHDDLLRVTNLQGSFGGSDINGDIRFQADGRPMLWATLGSDQLNMKDLNALWEPESEKEKSQQLFSDEPWDLEALRKFDAVVRYRAANANARDIPLSDVQLEMELRQGVLTLDPVRIGVGHGELVAQFRLNAQTSLPHGRLSLTIARVNLKPLLRSADLPEIAEDSAGVLGGKGQLRFQGRSLDDLMASLDGKLELAMSGGRLDMLLMEVVGLDVGESLVAALADTDQVPMQCAYARLAADNGLTQLAQFFVSTTDSNFTGGGSINLATEWLDVAFEAHPKDISLLESDSPVKLEGPLSDPQVSIVTPELLARGAATVIGALIAPPLAILPWVEPGLGEGVGPGCRQVLEAFQTDAAQN